MEVRLDPGRKLAEIWLTSEEGRDESILEGLKPLYPLYKKEGYLVAVFRSGEQDLTELTSALLCHNRALGI